MEKVSPPRRGWTPRGIALALAGALTLVLVALGGAAGSARAQTIAFTFEGGFDPRKQPRAAVWNAALLKALKDAKVRAMLFPDGVRVDSEEGLALVRDWGEQGHAIGNHTYAGRDYGSPRVSFADFRRDVLAGQALLESIPGWTPRLRYPDLHEGDTADKRDRMRDWMRLHNVQAAPVTIDPLDELYDRRWRQWQAQHPGVSTAVFREAYLNHLWGRANQAEAMARRQLGRSPRHVMRLRTSALNAAYLDDAIRLFRRKGWRVVSPQEAYADSLYEREPTVVPAGGSLVQALARQSKVKGLRSRDEDVRLEQQRLERKGL